MPLVKRCLAEFIGTFWLVLGGCGSAVTVLTMAYAVGHISGGHFNPAVSFGLWAVKRIPSSDLLPYIVAQVVGAALAGGAIYVIASGKPGFTLSGSNPLATNGYDTHSPGGYTLAACFFTEILLTFMFLLIILGVTDRRAPRALLHWRSVWL